MSKKIILIAKAHFDIEGVKQWAKSGFATYLEYDKDQELNIEKMATEFSEEVKKVYLNFAYNGDIEKKELSLEFLEIFGRV